MKKTVHIVELIEYVNKRNRSSSNIPKDVRRGWNALLETVLHNAGVYAGFRYLEVNEVPIGEESGVVRDMASGLAVEFPDESRREYYVYGKLQTKSKLMDNSAVGGNNE